MTEQKLSRLKSLADDTLTLPGSDPFKGAALLERLACRATEMANGVIDLVAELERLTKSERLANDTINFLRMLERSRFYEYQKIIQELDEFRRAHGS